MPSASNKLEKQSSIGSVGNAGGGGVGPSNQSVQSTSTAGPKTSISSESNSTSVAVATVAANNNISNECSITVNNSSSGSINAKGSANIIGGGIVGNAADANNPMKQSLITIDHKIRNLEKRKTKLESYRAIQASGKELSADQKAAVAKYDGVIATLDFARELSKQMMQYSKDAEKEQKKQARKDLIAKAHAETAKMREMLIIQNILSCFSDETVRVDFLNGENGAIKMDAGDLAAVEKFCLDIQIRRPETADDVAFVASAQKAAEYFSMTIDGRPKQYAETTFENLRRVFNQIQECGYLDKIYFVTSDVSGEEKDVEEFVESTLAVSGIDCEETVTAEEGFLEEGMESLNMGDDGMIVDAVASGQMQMAGGDGNGNIMLQTQPLQQQPLELQQQQVKEQMEMQQQQINASIQAQQQQHQQIQQQGMQVVPPSVVPPNFQQVPPQQQQPSGTTTPVHHVAMFPTQQQQQMQPLPPQQLQQVAQPPPGSIISVPPPQMVVSQQQVPPPQQQQRQLMTSPGSAGGTPGPGQLPPQGGGVPMPLHGAPPPAGHFPPTTVRAVEQSFFKQHQQYIQQMRPLNEVIAGGSFYFLQESELDSPEMANVIGVAGNAAVPVVGGVIFEQQAVPPQMNVMSHADMATAAAEMHKTQQQQQQPIPTQTFTNQSFPPIPQQQQQQQQQIQTTPPTAGNSGNASVLTSQTPSPMFQQKHQQLFSPVAAAGVGLQTQQQQQDIVASAANVQQQQQQQQQMLLNEQQLQQQQQPMMIMTRLATAAAPQPHLQPPQQTSPQQQQQPPLASMQPSNFPFENSVVTSLSYEQMQQQLAVAATAATSSLKSSPEDKKNIGDDAHINYNPEPVVVVNEWEATLKSHAVTATRAAPSNNAALASALKPASANSGVTLEVSNKWSTEMNAISTPTTPNNNNNSAAQQARKNDWAANSSTSVGGAGSRGGDGNGGSGYGDAGAQPQTHETNHWNSNQQQDVHFSNNGRYNNNPRRRGRTNNYGSSSSQQQNGGGGGRGGNGGGIYFRNNDNSSSGGGSSYYQNGGGGNGGAYSSGKDTGSRYDSGNYRGPRGGSGNNLRGGNGPPTRSLGSRNGSERGGSMNSSSSSYLNARQSSNRMSMGMENKN